MSESSDSDSEPITEVKTLKLSPLQKKVSEKHDEVDLSSQVVEIPTKKLICSESDDFLYENGKKSQLVSTVPVTDDVNLSKNCELKAIMP